MTTAADRFKPQRVGPSTISRIAVVLLGGCLVLGLASPAEAQIGVGTLPNGATTGGGINAGTGSNVGTTQGLSQSGQIQSSAAIQRDQAAFIGRNGGEHPRSLASAIPTSVNSQFTPNTGTTLGGFGGAGSLGTIGTLGSFSGLNSRGFGAAGLGGGFGSPLGANQFGTQLNRGGAQQFGAQGQASIRTRSAIAFEPVRLPATVVTQRFADRLGRIPRLGPVDGVQVGMDGEVAVLTGAVASQRDRDLIGQLALLEPGIRSVRNELLVAPPAGVNPPLETPAAPPLPTP
ncbi:MAG: BON domain-containing protein [Planctomycetales bacterium]|nr:BON domain-containing protein [Planctomycetales bacterium]MCA9211108.1 BON domain-containing protein [Planctomycetales bacterium]MCA9222262.1 BON domain-containing protein [Planctomycetales bacterium]MCA9225896.1 BON domain-containing protein [Planctomycetales bacterium]